MKKLSLLIILIVSSGCSTISVESVDCRAHYTRFWFEQEGFKAKICGGEASVSKTSNNTDLMESLIPLIRK